MLDEQKEERKDRNQHIMMQIACFLLIAVMGIHYLYRIGYFDRQPEVEGVWDRVLTQKELDHYYNKGYGRAYLDTIDSVFVDSSDFDQWNHVIVSMGHDRKAIIWTSDDLGTEGLVYEFPDADTVFSWEGLADAVVYFNIWSNK